ncbi:phage virion morphogenesis protein [Aurantiacibacter xanthus]|uniref:Phage virion morphogenesis protein n=1 Tax=Aurantiacibacter xanthus TaxID=1784712 RepID=A0A3A1P5U1_9SPHN|nr:phage virion morphogenesis protein [Aurantiacibacter xanthus]RIV82959.1 phage virion morphogenesis protein [Aurantiacibacter xanthus]
MFGVQFNAGASREVIRRAAAQLANMTPVYEDIREYLLERHRRRFVDGKTPDGVVWAPKSQATLARYKALGYGSLRKPLIGPSKLLSRTIASFANQHGVVIGSNQINSRVMDQGAAKGAFGTNSRGRPIPWGRIPARQWLGMGREDNENVIDIVEEWLEKALDQ